MGGDAFYIAMIIRLLQGRPCGAPLNGVTAWMVTAWTPRNSLPQFCQQLVDRAAEGGVNRVRGEVREGFEHEPAFVHVGVRHVEAGRVEHLLAIEQQVEIETRGPQWTRWALAGRPASRSMR